MELSGFWYAEGKVEEQQQQKKNHTHLLLQLENMVWS